MRASTATFVLLLLALSGAVAPKAYGQAPNPAWYVALGDSFSSGEGVDPYLRDGANPATGAQTGSKDNRCHRSTRAYAEQVVPPGLTEPLYELVSPGEAGRGKGTGKHSSDANVRAKDGRIWAFLACSGAVTSNVKPAADGGTPHHQDFAPQLDSPAIGRGTSLVTITIGGNDVGFSDTVLHCARHACNTRSYRAQLDRRLADLAPKLEALYSRLAAKAPNARIVVLGYPQLFPAGDDEQRCGKLRPWRGEQDMLRSKEAALNALVRQKAAAAQFDFVDVAKAFAGHAICGDNGEWINGPSATYKPKRKFTDDESFHPTQKGQAEMARAVNARLRRPASSSWRFDQDGFGPARIGMTISEAQNALGVPLENAGGLGVCWNLADDPRKVIFAADAPEDRGARISAIVSLGEPAATTNGLRVGDPLSRAADLYGRLYHDTGNRVGQGIAASIFDEGWANQLGIYVHGPDDERINGFVAGQASEEYCA